MDFLIDEYGQSIMCIIFGAGVITLMGSVLSWVIGNPWMVDGVARYFVV